MNKSNSKRRRIVGRKRLVPLILLCSLNACGTRPTFQLILDPYTWEIWQSSQVNRTLEERIRSAGYRPRLTPAPAEGPGGGVLSPLIQRSRPDLVYLSPLLPPEAWGLVSRFPEVLFILESSPDLPRTPNLIRINYEREQAFREAGRRVGRLLASREFGDFYAHRRGAGDSGSLKAGILTGLMNKAALRETEAFRRGYEEVMVNSDLIGKEIGNLSDRVKARRLLERMKEEGVVVFLLKTYQLTDFCLEFLQKEGGLAVVEDWAASRGYEEAVLLSIEDDPVGALERVLSRISRRGGPLSGSQRAIPGPVRVEWASSWGEDGKIFDKAVGSPYNS